MASARRWAWLLTWTDRNASRCEPGKRHSQRWNKSTANQARCGIPSFPH